MASSSLRSMAVIVLSTLALACGPLPEPDDVGDEPDGLLEPSSDSDPGCCPTSPLYYCGGTLRGGWAGNPGGCPPAIWDFGATRIVNDAHGCPVLVHEGPCLCLCPPDTGSLVDTGPDAGLEEDASTP